MANDYMSQWNINGTLYDIHDSGRGAAEGVATLDANTKVPDVQLGRGQANGVASLDANSKVPTSQLNAGVPSGLATLDANGRIPYSQLPESAVEFKGYWNANTNSPTLADGTGTKGDFYFVDTAGSQNLGSGTQYFAIGDRVLYDGSVWKNIASGAVRSINGSGPDAQGNISGVVKSVAGNNPDSNGNVSGIVKSVAGNSPDSNGNVSGIVTSVNNVAPDANGNCTLTAMLSVNGVNPDANGNLNVTGLTRITKNYSHNSSASNPFSSADWQDILANASESVFVEIHSQFGTISSSSPYEQTLVTRETEVLCMIERVDTSANVIYVKPIFPQILRNAGAYTGYGWICEDTHIGNYQTSNSTFFGLEVIRQSDNTEVSLYSRKNIGNVYMYFYKIKASV